MYNYHKLLKRRYLKSCFRKFRSTKCDNSPNWESVIGLEIHAQILSISKLFSGASTNFASPVNTNVALFDAAIPGTLPVLNKRCVEAGVLTALALSCRINPISMFDRKHYFYSDLPAGYQITQQRFPLANDGCLKFQVYNPAVHKKAYTKASKLKQLQLEQDSGKSLHDEGACRSLIDLNRAGIPLMELVFEPDLDDGEEAAALVKELSMILERLGTCSCKMEEGALRVDANVSVRKKGDALGVRTEIKNIGSIRGVAAAVNYEIERQISVLETGGKIVNETRNWDAQEKITVAMRDKEVVQDYRFMPEPNLPPLHLNMGVNDFSDNIVNVKNLQKLLPELPEQTRELLCKNFHLTSEQAIIIVSEEILLKYFKDLSKVSTRDPKIIVNILSNELLTLVNKLKLNLNNLQIPHKNLGEIIDMIQSKTININTARKLMDETAKGNQDSPSQIVLKNNWAQISDENQIAEICKKIINENELMVDQYLSGKTKVFNALLGKVAVASDQRVNMAEAIKVLKNLLSNKTK